MLSLIQMHYFPSARAEDYSKVVKHKFGNCCKIIEAILRSLIHSLFLVFVKDDLAAVSYTHLTLPTNREV